MASGTIKGTFSNLSASNLYPEIRWKSTKNDTNNNSSVTAELWFVRVNTAYISNNAYFLPRITINGDAAYPPNGTYAPFDMRKGTHKVWQRTVTVAHNADGAKSITIAAGGITGLSNLGNVSVSGTAKLDTIPRASSISSISGNQIGGNVTVNISRASNSFTHRVGYYDTDGQRRSAIIDAGTSGTFTIPIDRCSLLPNATSGTAKIIVDTYSGGTKIGSTSKNHTMYVPSSVVPSITSFKTQEVVTAVGNLGLGTNVFVQSKSTIGMTAAANGAHGSTIRDYTFSYNGASQGGTVGRQFAAGNINGTREVKVVVTDSRGRKAESKHNVTILPYSAPKINKFNVYRVGNTTTVKADVSYTVSNIASKGGTFYIDKLVGSTWSMTNSGTMTTTHSSTVTLAGAYDGAKSHSFRTNLHDAFGKGATANGTVGTNKVALDLFKDVGIGVGKTYERGTLDIGGDVYMNPGSSISLGGGFYNGILPAGNMSLGSYWHQTIFPKGISHWHKNKDDPLTNPPGGINGWGMMQVMKNQNGAGEFTVIYFTQANGRIFRTGGNSGSTNLTWYEVFSGASPELDISTIRSSSITSRGNIWADGNISTGSNMFIKGATVHADYTPQRIWDGTYYMTAGHTATPSKALNQCRNGWILGWCDYTNGVANNYDWNFTLIPKSAYYGGLTNGTGGVHCPVSMANDANIGMFSKYVYITNTQIKGNAVNGVSPLNGAVLRAVYEF